MTSWWWISRKKKIVTTELRLVTNPTSHFLWLKSQYLFENLPATSVRQTIRLSGHVEQPHTSIPGFSVIWGQRCKRVAAGLCLPIGPITQLSPWMTRNPGTHTCTSICFGRSEDIPKKSFRLDGREGYEDVGCFYEHLGRVWRYSPIRDSVPTSIT